MRKIISENESREEDKTGSNDMEDKKVREDLLDKLTVEQSHE